MVFTRLFGRGLFKKLSRLIIAINNGTGEESLESKKFCKIVSAKSDSDLFNVGAFLWTKRGSQSESSLFLKFYRTTLYLRQNALCQLSLPCFRAIPKMEQIWHKRILFPLLFHD